MRPPPLPQSTQVLLSHLSSFRGMGTAAVECVSGCTCQPSTLDGTTSSRVSIFKSHSFKVRWGAVRWEGAVRCGGRVVFTATSRHLVLPSRRILP